MKTLNFKIESVNRGLVVLMNNEKIIEVRTNTPSPKFLLISKRWGMVEERFLIEESYSFVVNETRCDVDNLWDDIGIEYNPELGYINIQIVSDVSKPADREYQILIDENWVVDYFYSKLTSSCRWLSKSMWLNVYESRGN